MQNPEPTGLTLSGGLIPVWLAVLIGVAAGVVAFGLYFRERARIGPVRRAAMAVLRIGVVGTALFLLLRPTLVAETEEHRARGVAVIVDDSLSMTQVDQRLSPQDRMRVAIAAGKAQPGTPIGPETTLGDVPAETPEDPPRAEMVRQVFKHRGIRLMEGLERLGPVRLYLFGQRLRSLEDIEKVAEDAPKEKKREEGQRWAEDRLVDSLRHEEKRTALADSILETLHRREGELPTAIVVVSDGRDNASSATIEEAADECRRLGVPLHIYGVGASDVGNLELKDFVVPPTIFFDDTVPVPIRWRCRGYREGTATIRLRLGDQVVAEKRVPLREDQEFRDTLTFTPHKTAEGQEEKSKLTVTIEHSGGETFTDDNTMSRPVEIVDRKVKILYIENSPRWAYKFLQPALIRDRRVEARFLLAQGDRRSLESGPPYLPRFPEERKDLFEFDLIIYGDVPADYIGQEGISWIRDFVREGGSLVFIAGRQHAPAEYRDTPLEEVLPVEFQPMKFRLADRQRPQAYVPVLTRHGERAEMLRLADTKDENLEIWQTLPGFYWYYPVTRLRPGAIPLLVHPRDRVEDKSAPILASQFYGRGQVLYMGTDETWRWRYNVSDKYFGRFWGQVIYQMGLPHLIGAPKRVQLSLDRPENVQGREGYVYARVFDPNFRPFTGDRIHARLEKVDAKPGEEQARPVILEQVSGVPGEYRALLSHHDTGRFVIKVDDPALASLEYRVNLPPQHELEVAGMAEEALRTAAGISGGSFYREENIHTLPSKIQARKVTFTVRHETLLWNSTLLFLFLALITAEWILRKFSNLS